MHPVELFELVIAMCLAIIILHFAARRLFLPPAVALLAGGTALAFLPGLPAISLNPELVLVIFLPPLLMDGAWFTALGHFRRHLVGILSLAIGAVVFTTIVVAVVAHLLLPSLPWAACAALGAIVSPPDAVSARAVLQRVRLPRRVMTLLEGESLLNDATGLVLFRFAVAATVTGAFSASDALMSFGVLAVGGVVVGLAIGGLWVLLARRLGDDDLVIAISMLVCWSAYLAGEKLHVSGVIATVTAGLVTGWYQHVVLSARTRMRGTSFWSVMVFFFEAAVFILIGFSLRGVLDRVGGLEVVIEQMAWPVTVIVVAMTLARFAWVFASDLVIAAAHRLRLTRKPPLGPRASTVISWAGMRGVVTLAVALTLPEAMPGRDFMLVTAFAVILGTVLIQGMTLGFVIRLTGVGRVQEVGPKLTLSQAEAAIGQVQLQVVERLAYDEEGKLIHPQLLNTYQRRAAIRANYPGREEELAPNLKAHFDVVLAAIAAGRAELVRLHRAFEIDEETLHDLERDLDLEELSALSASS
ncbi:Na+/H+ antiporter [Roseococcus pinisoli]|uniref:Na+/H+ antiporter n=1 Tax=Roseococcus pinisoli TaxID=2835040 RepID=A0ABS5QJB1_9PROT|nr:Na+/H+ antiporter [Roseococcus pinisoli]MBS7812613.1 Na+/H+ antiporter [Roseococcus pinisoli]